LARAAAVTRWRDAQAVRSGWRQAYRACSRPRSTVEPSTATADHRLPEAHEPEQRTGAAPVDCRCGSITPPCTAETRAPLSFTPASASAALGEVADDREGTAVWKNAAGTAARAARGTQAAAIATSALRQSLPTLPPGLAGDTSGGGAPPEAAPEKGTPDVRDHTSTNAKHPFCDLRLGACRRPSASQAGTSASTPETERQGETRSGGKAITAAPSATTAPPR